MRDRAVSTALSYTITLGIVGILVVGLLTAGGGFVGSQSNSVVDSELQVIGERLAADIASADRLARLGDGAHTVNVTASLPRAVSGSNYRIDITTGGGNATIELTSSAVNRVVSVNIANKTAIEPASVNGGNAKIVYEDSTDRLEVHDAD